MIAVPLPSLADELDQLPLRYSERFVTERLPAPKPIEFTDQPRLGLNPRRRGTHTSRDYMREYMRAYRAR